ncbi:MAG: helix-turn-helix domain-containing protein [Dissulfurispiraceae bacterium]
MSSTVSGIFKEQEALEKKASKAARAIFESDFGKEAADRVEELTRKFNSKLPFKRRRRFTVFTSEDPKRVIAWAVGQRVRMERERQGLRQEDLAEKVGIKRPNIARLEKGRHLPSLQTVQKIARALNLDLGNLMAVPAPSEEDMIEFREIAETGIQEWGNAMEEEDGKK